MNKPNPFRDGPSLKTREPAEPTKLAPIGLVPSSDGEAEGVGIVKAINAGDEYGGLSLARAKSKLARVTVQFGEDPPILTRQQRDKMDYDEREALRPPQSTFEIPPAMAKGLSIGDRVCVEIKKVSE